MIISAWCSNPACGVSEFGSVSANGASSSQAGINGPLPYTDTQFIELPAVQPFAEFDWISIEDSRNVSSMFIRLLWIICLPLLLVGAAIAAETPKRKAPTMANVLAESKPSDWRTLDPENTLYVEFASGRVVIELAPLFAPRHVANVKALARENYYDGLVIVRAQDNYVVQWGDPDAEKPELARKIQRAQRTLPAEFVRVIDQKLPFTRLPDGDVYVREVGFSEGFPVARDKRSGKMWLVHSYGMVGAGRDTAADSGGGTELYVVIGQAPRHLDRNVTLLGRVVQGIELLSSLPRGTGPMGFYEKAEQRLPIKAIRVAADVPPAERSNLELMRTDTPAFRKLIESRRNRAEDWFLTKAGRIDLCNVPIPVRSKDKSAR
jgi:peptidylprolyl isomerase